MTYSRTTGDEVRQAFATGARLDLAGDDVPAALLVELLAGAPLQPDGRIPALRLGAVVRGPLQLPGATVPVLVELTGCTFDELIDLYAADLAGWRLTRCTLPGLRGGESPGAQRAGAGEVHGDRAGRAVRRPDRGTAAADRHPLGHHW